MLLNPHRSSGSSLPMNQPNKDRQKLYGHRRSRSTSAVQGGQGRLTSHHETFPRTWTHTGSLAQPHCGQKKFYHSDVKLWRQGVIVAWRDKSRGTSGGAQVFPKQSAGWRKRLQHALYRCCIGTWYQAADVDTLEMLVVQLLSKNQNKYTWSYIPYPRTYTHWIVLL